ncbi:MAG: hypothetical protein SFU99_10400 [Saprospiraceae bacterium]|nr:hypothetical protein [Saprospiraceae bacterium]
MRKLASISLSVLVLLTSLSFGVNFHLCQGEIKSFAFFSEAKPCYHKSAAACPLHQGMQKKNDCCDNQSKLVKGQEHQFAFAKNLVKNSFTIVYELPVFEYPKLALFEKTTPLKFQNLKPPLIGKHVRVLIQSFLC